MNVTQIKERPIIFSGPMVQAILEGRKMQTRRVIKSPIKRDPVTNAEAIRPLDIPCFRVQSTGASGWNTIACPYGQPGDRLWVREAWAGEEGEWVAWRASFDPHKIPGVLEPLGLSEPRWRSPIHMPRWASRLTLEITDVRVERAKEVSEEDAQAEGAEPEGVPTGRHTAEGDEEETGSYRAGFAALWDTLNAKRGYPWADNPWVWAITFKRVEPSED